jgi:hypothetical protein
MNFSSNKATESNDTDSFPVHATDAKTKSQAKKQNSDLNRRFSKTISTFFDQRNRHQLESMHIKKLAQIS